jgi:exodeoxyribonuclease VII large subunit
LASGSKLLEALSYGAVLARGFALVTDVRGRPLKRAAEVARGQRLKIRFSDDTLDATARPNTTQGELF